MMARGGRGPGVDCRWKGAAELFQERACPADMSRTETDALTGALGYGPYHVVVAQSPSHEIAFAALERTEGLVGRDGRDELHEVPRPLGFGRRFDLNQIEFVLHPIAACRHAPMPVQNDVPPPNLNSCTMSYFPLVSGTA